MATQNLSGQIAESKAISEEYPACRLFLQNLHTEIIESLSQFAGTLESMSLNLDLLGDKVINADRTLASSDTPAFSTKRTGLSKDLGDLLVKLCLVQEYALLVQERDNMACGLDGVALTLNDLISELIDIINSLDERGGLHEKS